MSLPKPGAWMEWVKSLFGVLLFAAALYYLKNVVPALGRFTSGATSFPIAMAVLVVAGAAAGAIHASFHGGRLERARKAIGVALMTVGLFGASNYLLTPKGDVQLTWLHDEPAAVADARGANRPLLIDFAADWCLPCKELERKTFAEPRVAKELSRFVLVRVDCTDPEDRKSVV